MSNSLGTSAVLSRLMFSKKQTTFLVLVLPLLPIVQNHAQCGQTVSSSWDMSLPQLELKNVSLKDNSLLKVWKQVSTDLLLRSVLFTTADTNMKGPFSFAAAKCTAAELFHALCAAYPHFIWTQDAKTGVLWIHPGKIPYDKILTLPVDVRRDLPGIAMQSGILERVGKIEPSLVRVTTWGDAFMNTFDYTVDVPMGKYTVRDILNLCCAGIITRSFYIHRYAQGFANVTAVNITPEKWTDVPPGALHFWRTEMQVSTTVPPGKEEIIAKVCHANPRVRWAGRRYLEALTWKISPSKWIVNASSKEQALWLAVSFAEQYVRIKGATLTSAMRRLKRECNKEFLLNGKAPLAVLSGFELARLTKDASPLEILAQRKFSDGELSGIVSRLYRIARSSESVREKLSQLGTDWLASSDERLRDLATASPQAALQFPQAKAVNGGKDFRQTPESTITETSASPTTGLIATQPGRLGAPSDSRQDLTSKKMFLAMGIASIFVTLGIILIYRKRSK